MSSRRVPLAKWREMSDADQRAVIRAGLVDFDDLPTSIRSEVEEMLATSRPVPSKT